MARRLKLLGVSGIDSEHSVFLSARLKLTGMYVLILALILIGFSFFLYQNISHNLIDASEDASFADSESHQHFAESTLGEVRSEILFVDLFILIIAAGISYILAGYTLRPIQDALSAQKKFSENASHELRTPLAVMKNEMEVLLRNPSPSKDLIYSTLTSNVEEIDRLTRMAADLLVLARSQYHPQTEMVDFAEIVQKIAEKMRSLGSRKGISISIGASEPIAVRGNTAELERVITNLLQNAIEHTEKGSVTISIGRQKAEAVLKIVDTGVGIKPDDLPHIFERFYKGPEAAGTGLGLSIVKEILSRHKGQIDIASVESRGTTVIVWLPLA